MVGGDEVEKQRAKSQNKNIYRGQNPLSGDRVLYPGGEQIRGRRVRMVELPTSLFSTDSSAFLYLSRLRERGRWNRWKRGG